MDSPQKNIRSWFFIINTIGFVKNKFQFFLLLLSMFFIMLPAMSRAQTVFLSGFGTATIDGTLSQGEWDFAGQHDFFINLPKGEVANATLFIMNDSTNLYLALRFERNIVDPGNTLSFEFDNNNAGPRSGRENGDDVILFNPDVGPQQGFIDEFRTNEPPCPSGSGEAACGFRDDEHGGTDDGSGHFLNDGTFSVYEMSHPLDTEDDLHDFSLSGGDTVGFKLSLRIIGVGNVFPDDFGDTIYPSDGHIIIEDIWFSALPSDNTPNVGDTLAVDLNFATFGMSVQNEMLGTFTGSMTWNPNVLDYISHSEFHSGFTGTVNANNVGNGRLDFDGTKISGTNILNTTNSSKGLLTIEFDVIGAEGSNTFLNMGITQVSSEVSAADLIPILTVIDSSITVNFLPVVTATTNLTTMEDQPFELQIEAVDPDGDALSYTLSQNPNWMTIDLNTGLLTGTPVNEDVGIDSVKVKVEDEKNGSVSSAFTIEVINVNDPPELATIANLSAIEDELFEFQIEATDVDSDSLTFTLLERPDWLTIDPSTGFLSGTPMNTNVGIDSVTVKVDDADGGLDSTSFSIEVKNINDPPEITTIHDLSVEEDQHFELRVEAMDVDEDTLIFRLAQNPGWLSINTSTGLITGTPLNEHVGANVVTVMVDDGNQGTASTSFTIDVINVNDPPDTFSLLLPSNNAEIDTLNPTLVWQQAIDVDPQDSVHYEIILSTTQNFVDTLFFASVSDTVYTIAFGLIRSEQYYWKVIAEDTSKTRTESEAIFIFSTSDVATKVSDLGSGLIPTEFGLSQNHPNPFNPETEISFHLPKSTNVVLRIYNTIGQIIRTLIDKRYDAGFYNVKWDGKDDNGVIVSSGIYFYQIQAGTFSQVKKMSLLK